MSVVTLYKCDRCHRMAFSAVGLKPDHYVLGRRCSGTVKAVSYVPEAELAQLQEALGEIVLQTCNSGTQPDATLRDSLRRANGTARAALASTEGTERV